ncbi:hypothetical protein AURDEDRAFT_168056 [Auricularia subglabra TFB-10046 SS5]|nr:hypothetical protein AURDEDRAFT_168056 [Auricularia subglabra TFB-10046 SS5]
MPKTPSSKRDMWTDVESSVWSPPTKVWSVLDPEHPIPACPGVSALADALTYTLIPGPPPYFNFNGTGIQIFGYAWVAAKRPSFPNIIPFIDSSKLTVSWALDEPLKATCMPFSITANFIGPSPHKLSITWDAEVGVAQEAILTHVLRAQAYTEPSATSMPVNIASGPVQTVTAPPSPDALPQELPIALIVAAITVPTTLVFLLALAGFVMWHRRARNKDEAKRSIAVRGPGHLPLKQIQGCSQHLDTSVRLRVSRTETLQPRCMTYEAVLRLAQKLASLLAESMCPSACPICLDEVASALMGPHGEHLPRLRQECHELFDNSAVMLTTCRTPDDISRLRSKVTISLLRCPKHRTSVERPACLGIFLDSMSMTVASALHVGENSAISRAENTKKAFGNSAGRWPARLEQLLPFGAEQSVASLTALAALLISRGPIGMLANCVLMGRGVILPALLSDVLREPLVSVLCDTLCLTNKECVWGTDPRTVVSGFFTTIENGPGALPRDFTLFVALGGEMKLYLSILRALSSSSRMISGTDDLIRYCSMLYLSLLGPSGVPMQPIPQPPRDVLLMSQKRPSSTLTAEDYADLMHVLIKNAGMSARCAAPGCGLATLRSGERAKFQFCSRCRIPRYCSKACQTRAWKHSTPPHKAVCALLYKFDAQAAVHLAEGLFIIPFRRALGELSDAEIDTLNAWIIASDEEFGTRLSDRFTGTFDVRNVAPSRR